jgi:hypothetical protein
LRSGVGLVFDHDRNAGQRCWHDQVDGAAVGWDIGDGNDLVVDESRGLMGSSVEDEVARRDAASVELEVSLAIPELQVDFDLG